MASIAPSMRPPTDRIFSGIPVDIAQGIGIRRQAVMEHLPAGLGGHPEDVLLGVIVAHLQFLGKRLGIPIAEVGGVQEVVGGRVLELGAQLTPALFKGVADVFEEDQPEDDVLVDGGIQRGQELVGRSPELPFEVAEKLLFDSVQRVSFVPEAGGAD